MKRLPVSSSRISSIGWENEIMEIEFKDSSIYHYFNVSYEEYEHFINSTSFGSELSKFDKVHKYTRIF